MNRKELPNCDSQCPLGPLEGNAVLFTGVEGGDERREANHRQAEQSESENSVSVDQKKSRKLRAVEHPQTKIRQERVLEPG